MKQNKTINIIGAGLAGCECAYQLLKRGFSVNLYEMKPKKFSPAHKLETFAELVCSNSLKSNDPITAGGLLKEEMRLLDALLIKIADKVAVPSGSALAVDRVKFSNLVTKELKKFKNLNIINEEVTKIDKTIPTVIATGPLTSDLMSEEIKNLIGNDYFYFFDAIAPIITNDCINYDIAFVQDRYDKGTGDYVNCPMNKDEYLAFHKALVEGEIVKLHDFENKKVFEGCMPIEVLAKRGVDTMRFGPLKPVGLSDKNGKRPYAVVQLRKETKKNDMFNIVGFQTNLTFKAQKEIFSMIPGLENIEFLRYGTMHKNSYINAPVCLNKFYQLKNENNIFIAGQLSGVEGYIESISSGLVAGINIARMLSGQELIDFGEYTMIGALANFIASASSENFQPMSANMGILNVDGITMKDKKEKNKILYYKSITSLKKTIATYN